MDENEYKSIRGQLISTPCVFEKSILALKTCCSKSTKKNIAEREAVMCVSTTYAERCADWLKVLRKKSQFSLHISEPLSVLPHSKEMKVQVGGMLGLCKALNINTEHLDSKPNIVEILDVCDAQTPSRDDLPFNEIIQGVVHFKLRR